MEKSGSDTPRTDYAASLVQYAVVGEQYEVVTAEFARQLERELSAAEAKVDALTQQLDKANDGLIQYARDIVAAMREKEELRETLRKYGKHDNDCRSRQPMVPPRGFNRYPCSCGFDAIRALVREQHTHKEDQPGKEDLNSTADLNGGAKHNR